VETYLAYLTVFTGAVTAALAAQAIVLFFIYRRLTKLADEVEKTFARVSDQSKIIIEQVAVLMDEINKQASHYGQIGHEISSRVQHDVNGLLNGVERIGTMTTRGAAAVVREARATMNGLLAALSHLGRSRNRKALPAPESASLVVR
jgi:uncharacterized protein YoxC